MPTEEEQFDLLVLALCRLPDLLVDLFAVLHLLLLLLALAKAHFLVFLLNSNNLINKVVLGAPVGIGMSKKGNSAAKI